MVGGVWSGTVFGAFPKNILEMGELQRPNGTKPEHIVPILFQFCSGVRDGLIYFQHLLKRLESIYSDGQRLGEGCGDLS